MRLLSRANQGAPITKLRFHPDQRMLASVAGLLPEVAIWGWDPAGRLDCLTRIRQPGGLPVRDLAWHPRGDALALATAGRAVELWSVPAGKLLREYGRKPVASRSVRYFDAYDIEYPVEQQGYANVAFSADGELLVAGESIDERTEVFCTRSGGVVGLFWSTDTGFALHPEGEVLATLTSDQMATAVRFGRLTDAFRGYDARLLIDYDGYRRLVFSPRGDAFALIGHAYATGIKVFEFPSCRMIFELDYERGQDAHETLLAELRGLGMASAEVGDGEGSGSGRVLRSGNDRLAFHPDGRTILFGTTTGSMVGVDLADSTKPSGIWKVHEGAVLALDVSYGHAVLATGHCDGSLKLWGLDRSPSCQDPPGRARTEAFLERFRPIDPMAKEEQFRTTDGRRWYDLDGLADEAIDPSDPPWVQIAKRTGRDLDRPADPS